MSQTSAIISVHDVMPNSLFKVESMLSHELAGFSPANVQLLIVPGLPWTDQQISVLHSLEKQGYEFVGHGWHHRVERINTVYHWLHSKVISRYAAEHLSLTEQELICLLENNYQWFKENDFKLPQLYVPPAWAMGRIRRQTLKRLSFCGYESTAGLLDVASGKSRSLPLVGFEADSHFRARFLRTWNEFNWQRASPFRPLRVSVHPFDLDYLLAGQLREMLTRITAVNWRSLFTTEVTSHSQKADESRLC